MATPFPFGSGNVLTAAQMNAITTLPINDQTASYTAVVGDVGKRIVMNVASANTLTIDNSIFGVGDMIFVANKGAGVTTLTAGAGVTINPSGSLALAQYAGGTLVALSASVFIFFPSGGASKMRQVAAFTASGTWTVPAGVTYAVANIRAGGGGVGTSAGAGGTGGTSSVAFAGGTVSATGGLGYAANQGAVGSVKAGTVNSGQGATNASASYTAVSGFATSDSAGKGQDGAYIVAGGAVTAGASITVTVGAGGVAGTSGAAGGSGYVWIEFEV
jgi:hypothetical protein